MIRGIAAVLVMSVWCAHVARADHAEPVVHNYTLILTATYSSPDGVLAPSFAINGKVPGPTLYAQYGDKFNITIVNLLNESTTLHFHGLWQYQTNFMDGVPYITQCPIPPGTTFSYIFPTSQAGTYWYHSHVGFQRDMGVFGAIVINHPHDTNRAYYDEDRLVLINDWFHEDAYSRFSKYMRAKNAMIPFESALCNGKWWHGCKGAENLTSSRAMNGNCTEDKLHTIVVNYGNRTMLRVVAATANVRMVLELEDHVFQVISADGLRVLPRMVASVTLASGQSYDLVIHADEGHDIIVGHPYLLRINTGMDMDMDTDMDDMNMKRMKHSSDHMESAFNEHVLAVVKYRENPQHTPQAARLRRRFTPQTHPVGQVEDTFDEFDSQPLVNFSVPEPTRVITVNITRNKTTPTFYVNGRTFTSPERPLVFGGAIPDSANVLCSYVGDNVRLIINNMDFSHHPIHLHGDHYRILGVGDPNDLPYDPRRHQNELRLENPAHRHTFVAPEKAWTVIQFKTTNPGFWFMHCHMSFHVEAGLAWVIRVQPPPSNSTTPFACGGSQDRNKPFLYPPKEALRTCLRDRPTTNDSNDNSDHMSNLIWELPVVIVMSLVVATGIAVMLTVLCRIFKRFSAGYRRVQTLDDAGDITVMRSDIEPVDLSDLTDLTGPSPLYVLPEKHELSSSDDYESDDEDYDDDDEEEEDQGG